MRATEFPQSQPGPRILGTGTRASITDASSSHIGPAIAGRAYLITSSAPIHIATGADGIAATVNSMLVGGPGVTLPWEPTFGAEYIAAIAPSGVTATLHIALARG